MESDSPKPQPTSSLPPSPPVPIPVPTQSDLPPMATAMTTAQLEAAIAALPAKKQRLHESFDRLVACSPVPIPFRWDDLDAHIFSLQSSIAVRFRQLQSLQAAAAPATTNHVEYPVEHREEEEDQERYVSNEDEEGNEEGGQAKKAPPGQESEEENERVEEAIEASPDQEDDVEGESEKVEEDIKASPDQEDDEKNENERKAEKASAHQGNEEAKKASEEEANSPIPDYTGGGGGETAVKQDLAVACANMDASRLADMLCWGGRSCFRSRRQFLPALLGSADPHALVVRAVTDFLARTEHKMDRVWENCVALLDCVPDLTAAPSVDTLEQANRLAEDWKQMIGKPESCRDLGRLAVWGLFNFLVSYKIVLEFDADEIIHLFGNIPRKKKQNCIELCKCLGLIHRMTDSIDHLIENWQQLDAIRLACALNLTDKYPPLSIMKEYVEKAKKIAQEIISKESDSLEYLDQAMAKQVNALILSWRAVDEYNIDSVHRNSIKAEITQLLHKYANKRQSLADASSSTSSPHQQHKLEEQYQQQQQMPEELHHPQQKLQEQQQQQKPQEEHYHRQRKPQELQQKQLRNQQEMPEQEWRRQEIGEQRQNNKRKRKQLRQQQQKAQEMQQHRFNKQPRLSRVGSFAHSPYNARPGIRNRTSQEYAGIQRVPSAPCARPRYPGPYNRSQRRPA